MTKLVWGETGKRYFEAGLDRGVLYMQNYEFTSDSLIIDEEDTVDEFALEGLTASPFPVNSKVKFVATEDPDFWLVGKVIGVSGGTITVDFAPLDYNFPENWDFIGYPINSLDWNVYRYDNAVAWDGLLSVDEAGGGGVASSFLDGRPFLNTPKPGEYAAAIKAITYPTEFNRAQGILEPVPGMLIDSQISDRFDFSYRTKVGNDVSSTDLGYKIHLVYNATVVPDSISRTPISDTVSPNEFSWAVQTVPAPLGGYRSMAHITIDSRRVASGKLTALENVLYGTSSVNGRMPSPAQVQTLLT